MMNVDDMPYIERVRIASEFAKAVKSWSMIADQCKAKILCEPRFATEYGGLNYSGNIIYTTSLLGDAVLASEKVKLLRLWISEMHVLDRDVARFPIEFPCTCGVIVPDNVNDRCLMHQKGSMRKP